MTEADWRADPAWSLVQYDPAFYAGADPPAAPTPAAELAQPPTWASLYDGNRLVAVWSRVPNPASPPVTPSVGSATVGA